jgi:hypothetical protein
LVLVGIATSCWFVYELVIGRRVLMRFLVELLIVYGPPVLFIIAATVHLAAMLVIIPWALVLGLGGRDKVMAWLLLHMPDRVVASDDVVSHEWVWSEDPGVRDAGYFGDWFDRAINKDSSGFYSEELSVGSDGRIDPTKRTDGTLPMLPVFFHQIRVSESPDARPSTRGPTVAEFRGIMGALQEQLPHYEFLVEEDPERRLVRYRVRR